METLLRRRLQTSLIFFLLNPDQPLHYYYPCLRINTCGKSMVINYWLYKVLYPSCNII